MYTPDDVEKIKEVFNSYDYEDNGYIEAVDARDAFIGK